MGYYTAYELTVNRYDARSDTLSNVTPDDHDKIVEELRQLDVIGYALSDDLSCHDAVKWYYHDSDMIQISKMFPSVLFCLHGEGEETGDIWDSYYLNGKSQHCRAEIVIPPFDPMKLA